VAVSAAIEVPERLDRFETGSFLFRANWLAEEGSEFMNAKSSRYAAFLASRREFTWRTVWGP